MCWLDRFVRCLDEPCDEATEVAALRRQVESLRREADALREVVARLRRTDGDPAWSYECKICMEGPIESVFLPCGHALACRECATGRKLCPVCAMPVEALTAVHFQ